MGRFDTKHPVFISSTSLGLQKLRIIIYLLLRFLKSIYFCMCIIQNSSKNCPYIQILSFLKNQIFLLIYHVPIIMSLESWKKSQEMIFFRIILEPSAISMKTIEKYEGLDLNDFLIKIDKIKIVVSVLELHTS